MRFFANVLDLPSILQAVIYILTLSGSVGIEIVRIILTVVSTPTLGVSDLDSDCADNISTWLILISAIKS